MKSTFYFPCCEEKLTVEHEEEQERIQCPNCGEHYTGQFNTLAESEMLQTKVSLDLIKAMVENDVVLYG